MQITRRLLLSRGAAFAGASALGATHVWANTTLTLGDTQIDTVSDGHLVLPSSFLLGADPDPAAAAISPSSARAGITRRELL
ncbi:hypothetical protein LCGC14_3043920 [marine sediment metagenome]|uniref:Uncharacterized protein n=1 Tax=marine sediment metagenome TaxID=412755 RepID=A0A0F8YWQ8_9ZZZZ